jgi:hypothetical protein
MKSEIFLRGGLDNPNQLEIAQEIRFLAQRICGRSLMLTVIIGNARLALAGNSRLLGNEYVHRVMKFASPNVAP